MSKTRLPHRFLALGALCLSPALALATPQNYTNGPAGGSSGSTRFCEDALVFNLLPAGTTPTALTGRFGSGPVFVSATNPALGAANAAVVFDSSNPTGDDFDLGTPHESFGGPGVGSAGQMGLATENDRPLQKILIVGEDLVDANNDNLVDAITFNRAILSASILFHSMDFHQL